MNSLSIWQEIKTQLSGIFTRGEIKVVDSSGAVQQLQVKTSSQKILDNVPYIEPYGFTSNPPIGGEVLLAQLGADPANVIAVVVGNREKRIKNLAAGEIAIYKDDENLIRIDADGKITIKGKHIVIDSATDVILGKDANMTDQVVTTKCACVVGGLHPVGSKKIFAQEK